MLTMEELLTPDEAARLLKVSKETVIRRIKAGKITASKTGGVWRITRTDLQAHINAGSTQQDKQK